MPYISLFETLSAKDVPLVGSKNASLGEMIRTLKAEGILVPEGFATTAAAYWEFLEANGLTEKIKALCRDSIKGNEDAGTES